MGKAVKSIGSVFGIGGSKGSGSGAGDPNMAFFDIEKEIEPAKQMQKDLLADSLARTQAAAPAQGDVMQAMGQAALGKGPSLAEAQLKQAQDRNLAQQLATIQAQRGGSAASNQRALLQNMASSGRDLASQSAIERMGERDRFLAAAQQQGQVARGDIDRDVALSTMAKREKQQPELARAQADLARTQARKQRQSQITGGLLSGAATLMASDEDNKNIDGEDSPLEALSKKNKAGKKLSSKEQAALFAESLAKGMKNSPKNAGEGFAQAASILAKNKGKNKKAADVLDKSDKTSKDALEGFAALQEKFKGKSIHPDAPFAGSVGDIGMKSMMPQAASAAAANPGFLSKLGGMFSDERDKKLKSKKKPDLRNTMGEFLDKLEAKSYTYKDTSKPGTRKGQQYGITAQDLEKSKVGKTMVQDTPDGKMVDTVGGFGAVLASQAELNKRLKALEKKKGSK